MKRMLSIVALFYSSCVAGNDQLLLLPTDENLTPVADLTEALLTKECKVGPKFVSGYWENWKGPIQPGAGTVGDSSHYTHDFGPMTHIFYSFLTLAKVPNPDSPPVASWDGQGLYESMTAADIMEVLDTPQWGTHDWQKQKMDGMMGHAKEMGKKWLWAIGGWSDLTRTIRSDQVDAFVSKCVALLEKSGDGIDFDWEHLSMDASLKSQQLQTLAETLLKLRQGLDSAGLQDKLIGYTTRFNAFWDDSSRPAGVDKFDSDGEGLIMDNALKAKGSSLKQVISFAQIMLYDVPPAQLGAPEGLRIQQYRDVFHAFERHLAKDQIVMGFEPGGQAAGGKWEGFAIDEEVINYVQNNGYGGVMFWAINETGFGTSEKTGENANRLAKYAQKVFNHCAPDDTPIGPDDPVNPVDPNPPKPDPPTPDPPTPDPPVDPPKPPSGSGASIFKAGFYCPYYEPPVGQYDTLAECENDAKQRNWTTFSYSSSHKDCMMCKQENLDQVIAWAASTIYQFD